MAFNFPEPAPWFETLPRDARGFFVLAEVGWEGGKPIFSKFSVERTVVLAINRACALCGYPMPPGALVYRAFAQGDAATIRGYEREHSHDLAGPLHLSCALYSAIVCPYLRERTSHLGKANTINPGAKRGALAAVMGFKDLGLMVPQSAPAGAAPLPKIAYIGLDDDIRYRDGDELRERYAAAAEADATIIDMSGPRLFWTDVPAEVSELNAAMVAGAKDVMGRTPIYGPTVLADGVDSGIEFMTLPLG